MTSKNYTHCNPGALLEMVGDDKETFLELAEIFLHDTVEKFKSINAAAQAQDYGALERETHAMKGTVGPLGADELFNMVESIEVECREHRCVCPPERIAALHQEMMLAREELENYIKAMP